jgi:hypothetical protein
VHEITNAVRSVERALASAPHSPHWRSLVNNRLAELRGAYIGYLDSSVGGTAAAVDDNPWLTARLVKLRRDQARVADEIDCLIEDCNSCCDYESLRPKVQSLLQHISRSRRREVGLLYESVDMDLGGEQ